MTKAEVNFPACAAPAQKFHCKCTVSISAGSLPCCTVQMRSAPSPKAITCPHATLSSHQMPCSKEKIKTLICERSKIPNRPQTNLLYRPHPDFFPRCLSCFDFLTVGSPASAPTASPSPQPSSASPYPACSYTLLFSAISPWPFLILHTHLGPPLPLPWL